MQNTSNMTTNNLGILFFKQVYNEWLNIDKVRYDECYLEKRREGELTLFINNAIVRIKQVKCTHMSTIIRKYLKKTEMLSIVM